MPSRRTDRESTERAGLIPARPLLSLSGSGWSRGIGALDSAGMLERSAGSSMDRASDYGSEGWGFDSLPARGSEATFSTAGAKKRAGY